MKYLFLINEKSRYKKLDELENLIRRVFSQSEDKILIKRTKDLKDAENVLKEISVKDFDCVIACGGDGTINFVLNQIYGKNVSLGIIPIGTVNALAKSLSFPKSIKKIVMNIKDKKTKTIDMGLVNNRYFLCFASMGYDAMVTYYVPEKFKDAYGKWAFFVTGIKELFKQKNLNRLRLYTENKNEYREVYSVLLSNTPIYAGVKMFPDAKVDDGLMDLYLFKKKGIFQTVINALIVGSVGFNLIKILAKTFHIGKSIEHIQANTLRVESDGDFYLQLDGEPIKMKLKNTKIELNFSIIKQAMKIVGTDS